MQLNNFTDKEKVMRKLIMILSMGAFLLTGISCSSTYGVNRSNGNNAAPGQVKKYYGAQSAKAFAPGQQKKRKKNKRN
ncbi:MAG: quinol oxidase subunit 4 [Leeuwenhoekiella sp.]|nr:MAG: quinol oxidase subunit 4 [Leeuwenhoekiella sp.]